jgi:pimeloyl-ACP methyl ester carboxylesterase
VDSGNNVHALNQLESALRLRDERLGQLMVDPLPDRCAKSRASGRSNGRIWPKPDGIACFAGDLSEQEQKIVWATQGVPDADLFNQKMDGIAWRSKPSWYIVAKNDRTVHPDLERFVAKRMGAKTYEADSSHVPMLSNPRLVIDVIRTAANAVTNTQASKRA